MVDMALVNSIPGFGPSHDFANFYEKLVEMAPRGATIVETGCYNGRSLCHLGMVAREANKGLRIVGVDHCVDESAGMSGRVVKNLRERGLSVRYSGFLDVLRQLQNPEQDRPHADVDFYEMPSIEASLLFSDNSVWCVFLDDGHLHTEVESGIDFWAPKVAPDGWLAGHDARMHSVWQPVKAKLENVIHDPLYNDCWRAPKQTPKTGVDIYKHVDLPNFGYGAGNFRNDGKPSGEW